MNSRWDQLDGKFICAERILQRCLLAVCKGLQNRVCFAAREGHSINGVDFIVQ